MKVAMLLLTVYEGWHVTDTPNLGSVNLQHTSIYLRGSVNLQHPSIYLRGHILVTV
jgi:hypothetical protein